MKIITEILEEFLDDQKTRLKPNSFEKYMDIMELFQDYLNYHTYQLFDDKEMANLDQKFIEGTSKILVK